MKLLSLILVTLLSCTSHGQNRKSSFIINVGFHHTDTYQKLFYHLQHDEGGYPIKQFSSTFLDLNLLYTRQTKNPNQKGFGENGMASDGTSTYYFYVSKLKKTYLSFYGGLSYDLFLDQRQKLLLDNF